MFIPPLFIILYGQIIGFIKDRTHPNIRTTLKAVGLVLMFSSSHGNDSHLIAEIHLFCGGTLPEPFSHDKRLKTWFEIGRSLCKYNTIKYLTCMHIQYLDNRDIQLPASPTWPPYHHARMFTRTSHWDWGDSVLHWVTQHLAWKIFRFWAKESLFLLGGWIRSCEWTKQSIASLNFHPCIQKYHGLFQFQEKLQVYSIVLRYIMLLRFLVKLFLAFVTRTFIFLYHDTFSTVHQPLLEVL